MIDRQINLNEVTGFELEESLRERFPWASDRALEESLVDAAIMINSILMAMESGAEDAALLVMAGERLEHAERRADAREEGAIEEPTFAQRFAGHWLIASTKMLAVSLPSIELKKQSRPAIIQRDDTWRKIDEGRAAGSLRRKRGWARGENCDRIQEATSDSISSDATETDEGALRRANEKGKQRWRKREIRVTTN